MIFHPVMEMNNNSSSRSSSGTMFALTNLCEHVQSNDGGESSRTTAATAAIRTRTSTSTSTSNQNNNNDFSLSLLNQYRHEVQQALLERRRRLADSSNASSAGECRLDRPWFHVKLKRDGKFSGGRNFGDDLNLDLASALLGIPDRGSVPSTQQRALSPKIVAVGSVLTQAMPGDTVLGTGLKFSSKDALPASPLWTKQLPRVKILSVRGPDTRAALIQRGIQHCPDKHYGDLGVTASLLIWPQLEPQATTSNIKNDDDVCIVSHATDFELQREAAASPYKVLSISPPTPLVLVQQMVQCKFLVSSSLHALMIAESYGVPVRWYNAPNSSEAPDKYLDYYRGIGRFDVNPETHAARTLSQAMQMGPMDRTLSLETMRRVTLDLIQLFPFEDVCQNWK